MQRGVYDPVVAVGACYTGFGLRVGDQEANEREKKKNEKMLCRKSVNDRKKVPVPYVVFK